MANSASEVQQPVLGMNAMLLDRDSPHYSDFLVVSQTMLDGYARFARLGLPSHTIALAMLGGTLNLYDLFGMRAELPELLRTIADRLDDGDNLN